MPIFNAPEKVTFWYIKAPTIHYKNHKRKEVAQGRLQVSRKLWPKPWASAPHFYQLQTKGKEVKCQTHENLNVVNIEVKRILCKQKKYLSPLTDLCVIIECVIIRYECVKSDFKDLFCWRREREMRKLDELLDYLSILSVQDISFEKWSKGKKVLFFVEYSFMLFTNSCNYINLFC